MSAGAEHIDLLDELRVERIGCQLSPRRAFAELRKNASHAGHSRTLDRQPVAPCAPALQVPGVLDHTLEHDAASLGCETRRLQ